MQPKKIIIIGASSGLGRILAIKYAEMGHSVAITARRIELLRAVQANFPQQIIISCFDVMQGNNIASVNNLIHELGALIFSSTTRLWRAITAPQMGT